MISLVEIFASIQGESTFSGFPCIFIRFSGCNLRCKYCDTTYSYKPSFTLNPSEIIQFIKRFGNIQYVEITGGEPMLQEEIYQLFELLNKESYDILLETNGTKLLTKVPDYVHKIVDVKCPGSGFGNSFDMNNLSCMKIKRDEFKFVLSSRYDYDWANNFILENGLQKHTILFSSVLSDLKPATLANWMVKDELPFRMQLQLHKVIWDPNKRGV